MKVGSSSQYSKVKVFLTEGRAFLIISSDKVSWTVSRDRASQVVTADFLYTDLRFCQSLNPFHTYHVDTVWKSQLVKILRLSWFSYPFCKKGSRTKFMCQLIHMIFTATNFFSLALLTNLILTFFSIETNTSKSNNMSHICDKVL